MNFAFYLHNEVDKKAFEQKLLWFKSKFNLISADQIREVLNGGTNIHNACMLSVDDGWRSTYDVIFPIMKKHNVPFTIFVSPTVTETGMNFWTHTFQFCEASELKNIMIRRGYFHKDVIKYPVELIFKEISIGQVYDVLNEYLSKHPEIEIPRGFINREELLEMHNSGLVEIGAHTKTHPILRNESNEACSREIKQSVEKLSEILDYKVHTFAYPNGLEGLDFSEREMKIAEEAGIDLAFSVNPGVITHNTNPLSIPRWGSIARLRFGRLGQYLPSRANQAKIRKEIRKYKKDEEI